MPVRFGFQLLPASGGKFSPGLSADLAAYERDYWPPYVGDLAPIGGSPVFKKAPGEPGAKARLGSVPKAYFNDFYFRIYITPSRLDLGNLASAQTRSIIVWNAWPDTPQSLTSVLVSDADGITVTGEGALPLNFAPLQQRTWSIAVDNVGRPVVDATLQWLFAGLDPVEAVITGNRLTAWMIAPDWANNLTETLSWLTDVQDAADGSQLRQPCREAPRREWEFGVIAEGVERQIMENALYDWSSRTWALPVWVDMTWLTAPIAAGASVIAFDTTGLDYVEGGLVAFYRSASSFELAEILTLTTTSITLKQPLANGWGKGDRIVPVRTATLTDFPTLNRKHDERVDAQVRFMAAEDCAWPAVAPAAMYLGIPVLETRTDEPQDLAAAYRRQIVTIDNDLGAPTLDDISGQTWISQPFYWLVQGRAARAALRSLLYWFNGRGNVAWVPSWNADITLAAPMTASATSMVVVASGITRFAFGKPGRSHIRIELKTGTVYYRRLTNAVEVDAQTEQLAIDTAIGAPIAPAQVRQINWMMLAGLSSDRVEIGHVHDSMGTATAGTTFVGVPKEEP